MECDASPDEIFYESDTNLVGTVLASIVKLPIVIIESSTQRYVRPFLPTLELVTTDVIYLAHNTEVNQYYNTQHKGTNYLAYFR